MGRLLNKTALITGAARGIGESIARIFHQEGAKVILSDIRDEEGKEIVKTLGESASYMHLDVKNEGEWQLVYEKILLEFGSLDILVNNAGITGFLEAKGPSTSRIRKGLSID